MSHAVAVAILVLVGAALVGAALYALFGKPSSRGGKKRKQEVVNGFRLAGGIVLGFFLMGSLVVLAGVVLGVLSSSRVSPPLAVVVVLFDLAAISLMVQRWANTSLAGLVMMR